MNNLDESNDVKLLLNAKFLYGDDILVAYLDLCGTKFVYKKFTLKQQIERINIVIEQLLPKIVDMREFLYVHMYADSIVIAERPNRKIENCEDKFVDLMINLQYEILNCSESLGTKEEKDYKPDEKRIYIPILSRALIKRGCYYGYIANQEMNTENIFANFSIVGGSAIVEMDKALKGLPMGTYVDALIIDELNIEKERFIDVSDSNLKFVKPPAYFDFLRSLFPSGRKNLPENLDDWGKRLVESTGNNISFKCKLLPWIDAIQGRNIIF